MPPITAETCALCASNVERRLAHNDLAHEKLEKLLTDVRDAQEQAGRHAARMEERLDQLRQPPRPAPWWKPVLLSIGGGALMAALGFGALTLWGHEGRITALEPHTAVSAQATP